MRLFFASLVVCVVCAGSIVAAETSPGDVVKKFCDLDAGGARLSSETWKQVAPLVAWEDEPGWDEVTVISGYELGNTKTSGRTATVAVTYHILGVNGEEFTAKKRNETVLFKLVRQKSGWRITDPSIEPHVSRETMVRHFRELERDEPSRRKDFEKTIAMIGGGDVAITRDFGCTARRKYDDGSFEEEELTLTLTEDRVTAVAYSGTMSNGEEGGAYSCDLDLKEPSTKSTWSRAGSRTKIPDPESDRDGYIEIDRLSNGSYRVEFHDVSSSHCGFGAEFPASIVIGHSKPKCEVTR